MCSIKDLFHDLHRFLKSRLSDMNAWILNYIASQDGLECVNSDVRVHTVFYAVCQALFYVIAFRHKDLVNSKSSKVSPDMIIHSVLFVS